MSGPIPGVRIRNAACAAVEATMVAVTNPASGAVAHEVAGGGRADAVMAVDAAAGAWTPWRPTVAERVQLLRAIAERLRAVADGELARLTTIETGKRLVESQAEVRFSATYFDWFADLISASSDELWDVVPGVRHVVRPRALGIAAVLTPWNFPLSIPARKIAPALAAGCPIVFKPSELTPASSLRFAAEIEPLLPPGVLNTVVGDAATISETWLNDERVAVVSFTGSTRVGRLLGAQAGRQLKETVFELGGRAPFIVCPDADAEQAVDLLMVAKYRNNGQSCIAANNVWVPEHLWDDVVRALTKRSMELRVGDPLAESTELGPVRLPDHAARLTELLEASGGEVVTADIDAALRGSFLPPTVCTDPDPDSALWQEEVFGPVAAVRRYRDLDEVVEDVNGSPYGLGGYLCGADADAATALAARLDVEIVGVNVATPNVPNVPFGGSKHSGLGGCEGGRLGLEPFLRRQSVAVASAPAAPQSRVARTRERRP